MSHLSTLTLHRIRYGELEGEPLTDARAHLDTCARCSARLQAQEAHRSAFVLQPVPAAIRAAAPPPEASPGWLSETFAKIRMGWLAAPLLAAVAAIAVLPTTDLLHGDGIYTKGDGAHLEAWLDVAVGPRALGDGEVVQTGDRIQLRFQRPPGDWVTFAGEDVTGEIEVYGTWRVDHEIVGWQDAPFGLTLDDTPGEQIFYAVFTNERPLSQEVSAELMGDEVLEDAVIEFVELQKLR